MAEALCDKLAPWMAGNGPESGVVVCCLGNLTRNLADFPFPNTIGPEQEKAIADRIQAVLSHAGWFAKGRYYPLANTDIHEALCLAELRLLPVDLLDRRLNTGLYVSEDQSESLAINGMDHLCLGRIASGLQPENLWSHLNALDDVIADGIDYSFHERFGYLSSSLSNVGTGLKISVILHLPALGMQNALMPLMQFARSNRLGLYGLRPTGIVPRGAIRPPGEFLRRSARRSQFVVPAENIGEAYYHDLSTTLYGTVSEAEGDLFLLCNQATLGTSEEEIVYNIRHVAQDLVARERAARDTLLQQERRRVEDRVMRALGIAQTARLLSLGEAVGLLSSMRLGLDVGMLTHISLAQLNDLLFTAQSAHLRMKLGHDCDEWTLNMERADLFRMRFTDGMRYTHV